MAMLPKIDSDEMWCIVAVCIVTVGAMASEIIHKNIQIHSLESKLESKESADASAQ